MLVTIDTLRADHVGVYGGDVETPHLDRLAREGAMFQRASAHSPLTRPSHVSMMTGRLPTRTGIRENVTPAVVGDMPVLAETLQGAGFRTAAFVSSVVLSSVSGLDRGFEVYSDDFPADPTDPAAAAFLGSAQRVGDRTLAEAVGWLGERTAAERFFLWLHLYDPHDPYEPPEPYASRYAERPYAGEVAWSDELVGRLYAALSSHGLEEDTLLAVTSDHGEGLGDHGETLHGFFVYETTLHVPLLIAGPGVQPGTEIERVTGLVDLFPTLLDLMAVPVPATDRPDAVSLAPALAGGPEPDESPLYAESLVALLHFGWSDLRVARQGRWKYIQAPRPELYDLETDPGEIDNLLTRGRPAEARELRRTLEGFLDQERQAIQENPSGSVSEDLLEQLGALGYLGGAAPAETPTPGADPKDKIGDFRFANDRMRRGLDALHAGRFAASAGLFEEILERGIESAEIHLYLGKALSGSGRLDRAAGHYREAVERTPSYASAWLGLADAHARFGDPESALEVLREARAVLPANGSLPREEGRILRLLRRPREAAAALRDAIRLEPDDAFAHAALGEATRDLGDLTEAIGYLERAVALDPQTAGYWNALGMTLGGAARLAEAEGAFARALSLDASNHRYAYNMGLALLRLDRPAEARPYFERTLELEPRFDPARERLREIGAAR